MKHKYLQLTTPSEQPSSRYQSSWDAALLINDCQMVYSSIPVKAILSMDDVWRDEE